MINLKERRMLIGQSNLISTVAGLQKVFYEERKSWCETDEELKGLIDIFDFINTKELSTTAIERIFYHPSNKLEEYPLLFSNSLLTACKDQGITSFYCLPLLKSSLFGNPKNKYTPLRKAYKELKKTTIGYDYKEAFEIEIDDLAHFLTILFWISRCDMASPIYIFLGPNTDQYVFSICKYGNLHISIYDKINEESILKSFLENGLLELETREFERFSEGAIDGRSIVL